MKTLSLSQKQKLLLKKIYQTFSHQLLLQELLFVNSSPKFYPLFFSDENQLLLFSLFLISIKQQNNLFFIENLIIVKES